MLTKNGSIIVDSYSPSGVSLIGILKNFSGIDVIPSSFSYTSPKYLLCIANDTSTSNYRLAKSASDVSSTSYCYISIGHRDGEASVDTYEPVFSQAFSFSINTTNKYGIFILTNTSSEAVDVNEIDCSIIGGSDAQTRVLCAIYPIGEITLEPGQSISFSFLHA